MQKILIIIKFLFFQVFNKLNDVLGDNIQAQGFVLDFEAGNYFFFIVSTTPFQINE